MDRKRVKRIPGIPGYRFAKKNDMKRWHVSLALNDCIKNSCAEAKVDIDSDGKIFRRRVLGVCLTRPADLDIKQSRDRKPARVFSPVDNSIKIPNLLAEREAADEDFDLLERDSVGEDDHLPNIKGFDYVRDYGRLPKFGLPVFHNGEDAISGNIQYMLTRESDHLNFLDNYVKKRSKAIIFSLALNSYEKESYKVNYRDSQGYEPEALVSPHDLNLLLRNVKMKMYEASYREESGRIASDTVETITLWGFPIFRILVKEINEIIPDLPMEIPTIEMRKTNTKLLKQLFAGLEDPADYEQLISPQLSPRKLSELTLNNSTHQRRIVHFSEVGSLALKSRSDVMIYHAKNTHDRNYQFYMNRFHADTHDVMRTTWDKRLLIGVKESIYPRLNSPLSSDGRASCVSSNIGYSKLPLIMVNQNVHPGVVDEQLVSQKFIAIAGAKPIDEAEIDKRLSSINSPSNFLGAGITPLSRGSFGLLSSKIVAGGRAMKKINRTSTFKEPVDQNNLLSPYHSARSPTRSLVESPVHSPRVNGELPGDATPRNNFMFPLRDSEKAIAANALLKGSKNMSTTHSRVGSAPKLFEHLVVYSN